MLFRSDQLTQDQRQRVLTWSIAPGYQRTIDAHTLLTINPYIRKDQFSYYPSRNALNDTPITQSQQRQLLNWGTRADISTNRGSHNLKFGVDLKQTRLLENFQFGITDPSLADESPSLRPYDLTRGGKLFSYHATANINQYAFFAQDSFTKGNFQFHAGLRIDVYDGLLTKTEPQPRLGISYNIKKTGTVLRASYARTMETPFNENLLLSNATGLGGLEKNLFGSVASTIGPGFRNQFNAGFQQALGRYLLLDGDLFWKYTHNGFDFNTLLNSTITFPIAWHNSKVDGFTGRVSTINIHGFQAFWTFGHSRARYYPPENGGLISQGAPLADGVFRIDHDQAFQSSANLRYQRPKNAEWVSLTYRYDSGLVVSGVPDAGAALELTPHQQVSVGLACNGVPATVAKPLLGCNGTVTSTLLNLPQGGYGNVPTQSNADHNPARVKPRNVFDLGLGTDNLTHTEHLRRITLSLEIANLTNVTAVYNFLSTFSGTHFLAPRSAIARIGMTF